ncbi:hypothetical protein LTR65_005132 [Meristemomyces frigidus]
MARSCIVAGAKPAPNFVDIEDVTELFILTKGVRDVISLAHDYIAQGPLAVMFWGNRMPASEESGVVTPEGVRSEFDRVQTMLHQSCEPEYSEPCAAALRELAIIYRTMQYFMRHSGVDPGHVLQWLTMVPMEFVRLIEQRHQAALVVLAYYAAAMTSVREVWYTKDWSVYALQGVRMALDEGMQHWLEWPEEQIRTDLAVLKESK